jgi:exonuclease III
MNSQEKDLTDLTDLDDVFVTNCQYIDVSDDSLTFPFSPNTLKIAHLNIHSLQSKKDDLIELLGMLKDKNVLPDILLLCETFLNDKSFSKINFPNYDIISQHRKTRSQGGVAILIGTHIRYQERQDLNVFDEGKFESVFVEIPTKNRTNYVIGEIYRVPGTNENEFLENYESIITKIRRESKKIIVGTDQNLDYLKINVHGNTKKLFELNMLNQLIPTITKPTRITHSTATLIDNIYVDAESFTSAHSYVITTDISDHFMCLVQVQQCSFKTNETTFTFRKIDENVLRNIKGALYNINWSFIENMSVNEGSLAMSNEITKALDFYAPVRIANGRKKYKPQDPWFSSGLKTSSMKCLKLYKEVGHFPHDSAEFRRY